MAQEPQRTAALAARTARSNDCAGIPESLHFGKGSVFGPARLLTFLDLAKLFYSPTVAPDSVYVRFRPTRLNRRKNALTFLVLSDAARASPRSS